MNKKIVMGIVGAALVVVAFVVGAYLGPQFLPGAGSTAQAGLAGGPGGAGGPRANLSDEERAKVEGMTEEERRAYFQEQMGAQGGQAGQGAPGGRMGGGVDGEVLTVSPDQITVKISSGGSQNVYIDDETVIAYAKGAEQTDLAAGDSVTIIAQPEADGVMTATTIVVK